ncbi:aminotransferase class IV [Kitasatospora cineracea]|uniref:aminotransferase class IV n=1 Tax=Kitasatospora cineracea TaxID=88074 RepID=UPI0038307B6C
MTLSPTAGTAASQGAAGPATGPRLVHHRGALVPAHEATLPVSSIALRYGVSVFEGVRLYRRTDGTVEPWLLAPHLERLRNSCRTMGLDERCCDGVPAIVDELVRANRVTEDSYLRISASAGNPGDLGDRAETVLTVSVAPSGRKRWLALGEGMRLTVSERQRPSEAVFPSAAKNISAYAGPRLAHGEAVAAGYDSCLLRTADGLISEAPTATVFLVEGERVVTPRLGDSVLPGVTRAWVLGAAAGLGLRAAEEAVGVERLRAADEVFLCGTGMEFAPVREIDGAVRSGWPDYPVTTRLVDAYFAQVRGEAPATEVPWTLGGTG